MSGPLPRPLRDPVLLTEIQDLDETFLRKRRAGCLLIEVHNDAEGRPKKAKASSSSEIRLTDAAE